MSEPASNASLSIPRLIVIPGLITLAVTLLRLAGELQHWSSRWFSATPYGAGTLVGITWLVPVFGIYFELKLARAGERPKSLKLAIGLAVLGVALPWLLFAVRNLAQQHFLAFVIFWWVVAAAAAALQYPAWPALFKTLLAYGLGARVPVVIIMFFAMRGQWGTHYDWANPLFPYTGFWAKWVWLGLIPQLTLWVGFTIVVGTLCAAVAAGVSRLLGRGAQPAS